MLLLLSSTGLNKNVFKRVRFYAQAEQHRTPYAELGGKSETQKSSSFKRVVLEEEEEKFRREKSSSCKNLSVIIYRILKMNSFFFKDVYC